VPLGFIYTSPTQQRDVTVMKLRAVSVSYFCALRRLSTKSQNNGRYFETCLCPFVARCGPHVSERATGSWPEVSAMSPAVEICYRGNLTKRAPDVLNMHPCFFSLQNALI
jgi:hypothetical protein